MPETGSFAIPFGLVATLNKRAEEEGKRLGLDDGGKLSVDQAHCQFLEASEHCPTNGAFELLCACGCKFAIFISHRGRFGNFAANSDGESAPSRFKPFAPFIPGSYTSLTTAEFVVRESAQQLG